LQSDTSLSMRVVSAICRLAGTGG